MKYYYFIASLPALTLGAPPPHDLPSFREACVRHLSPADLREVEAVLAGDAAAARSDFAAAWFDAETQVRNALAVLRAAQYAVDATPYLRPVRSTGGDVLVAVNEAWARPNPAEREQALDRFRWNLADELARPTPFDLPAVLAHAVKLQQVARWHGLKDEEGFKRLDAGLQALMRAPVAAART